MTRGVSTRRSPEQIDRVGEHREHGIERLADAGGAAGEIEDQRPSPRARDGAGERGHRGVREPAGPHQLGQAGSLAIDHGASRFRRDVPGTEAGPSGRHDEPVRRREVPEGRLDVRPLVRDDAAIDTSNPAAPRSCTATSPDSSSRVPLVTPSETVRTAARVASTEGA